MPNLFPHLEDVGIPNSGNPTAVFLANIIIFA
jgi:hypothetical protein